MAVNIEQMRFDMAQRQREADERAAQRQKEADERAAERQREAAERAAAYQREAAERAAASQREAAERAAASQKEQAWETRKFLVQLLLGFAAALGAGVALANYVNSRKAPPPAPQIIYLQPAPAPTR